MSIQGVGMDMIEVERVAAKIGKESGFRELVFSAGEISYCESKTNKYEHYAARFAAKEAFFKALGSGWMNGTAFHEVEIINDEAGKPSIRLSGDTAKTIAALGPMQFHVSLTHVREMAAAVVILESLE